MSKTEVDLKKIIATIITALQIIFKYMPFKFGSKVLETGF